jgi:hypothetical protein
MSFFWTDAVVSVHKSIFGPFPLPNMYLPRKILVLVRKVEHIFLRNTIFLLVLRDKWTNERARTRILILWVYFLTYYSLRDLRLSLRSSVMLRTVYDFLLIFFANHDYSWRRIWVSGSTTSILHRTLRCYVITVFENPTFYCQRLRVYCQNMAVTAISYFSISLIVIPNKPW